MRRVSPCYTRQIQCLSDTKRLWSIPRHTLPIFFRRPQSTLPRASERPPVRTFFSTREFSISSRRNNGKLTADAPAPPTGAGTGEQDNRSAVTSPEPWAAQFDALLPPSLRVSKSTLHNSDPLPSFDLVKLANIIARAQRKAKIDILAWMVENGRRKAAVWLMQAALKNLAAGQETVLEKHPSNIHWPDDIFEEVKGEHWLSTGSEDLTYLPSHAFDYEAAFDHDQSHSTITDSRDTVLSGIWTTLGRLVLSASNSPSDQSKEIMSAVLLILGQFHNHGMIPDDIYNCKTSPYSVYVQRPPILHLVSSRILTALSDAAWREQQDVAIAQATEAGLSLKEISESVPGGRFRLQVRPLGPEVWLEFILWCCVESGQIQSAFRIIGDLASQLDNPWFAVRWCSDQHTHSLSVKIDWERMKRRHGGTVGLIEGYSREKPFVDVPDRTISVEVVLALVEARINNVNREVRHIRTDRAYQSAIKTTLSFLEPHDLPPDYFDYMEARLIQAGHFDMVNRPAALQSWSSKMDETRGLERAGIDPSRSSDLQYESILANTLLHSGVQHQALDGLIQMGDVHRSLAQFNIIQENVDQHKFMSIANFLHMQPVPENGFFSSRLFQQRLEYADSHGQLPYYKLAGFLSLVSDTKLTGLGQWLLYSDDLDGALIPSSAYGLSCMATTLCKFASVSGDESLLGKVVSRVSLSRRKPTIRFLRRLFDADVQNFDFPNARNQLLRLRGAQAGGVGLTNIAHLAGIIMRLEDGDLRTVMNHSLKVNQANALMGEILRGDHNSMRGDFTQAQRTLFKQQIAHMLRLFHQYGSTTLQMLAQEHVERYRSGNLAILPAYIFNLLLSAIVSVRGSETGRLVWELYCQHNGQQEKAEHHDIRPAGTDIEGEIVDSSYHLDAQPHYNDVGRLVAEDLFREEYNNSIVDPRGTGSSQHDRVMSKSELPDGFAESFFQDQVEDHISDRSPVSSPDVKLQTDEEIPFDDQTGIPNLENIPHDNEEASLLPAPITRPNLQTIRIIVRGAVEEKRAAQNTTRRDKIERYANRTLKWSVSEFRRLGDLSPAIIEQEIQQPLASLDHVVDDHIARPEAVHNVFRVAQDKLGQLKDTPISKLWVQPKPLNNRQRKAQRKRRHQARFEHAMRYKDVE
ncbi:hypothetical protein PMZ80_010698 [Knufia obscura]|uniref:Uncharacterized protein n=2 Tax=Knufia TaxID=430999 RepID=A0AAN8EGX1_9EURO|nr:hypothetical protein PMZ80_010698 [Knufia obscura]KAK5955389.1 hypothetical protein OHC33_004072 [Knufia fluminis]